VKYDLPRLAPGRSKTKPVYHIVQTAFQEYKEVLTGDTGHTQSPLKEQTELLFLHPIDPLKLLLFPKLDSIVGTLACPCFGVFPRRGPLFIDRALIALTAIPLKHQFLLLRPA
jgi:hypothetical protein